MIGAYTLLAEQRQAVIAGIRKEVIDDNRLQSIPDDLLLIVLHALTGRTGDLIRHVSATADRYHRN
ncbi:MAG: hypothetical protein ABTR07_06015 [Candidatus Competibacter denitrificans]